MTQVMSPAPEAALAALADALRDALDEHGRRIDAKERLRLGRVLAGLDQLVEFLEHPMPNDYLRGLALAIEQQLERLIEEAAAAGSRPKH